MSACRHCGHNYEWRGHRGLCRPCYKKPEVRALYPPKSRDSLRLGLFASGRNRVKAAPAHPPLPAGPTDAVPGTDEKLRVMEERALRGEELFHPLDARHTLPAAFRTLRRTGTAHGNGRIKEPLVESVDSRLYKLYKYGT